MKQFIALLAVPLAAQAAICPIIPAPIAVTEVSGVYAFASPEAALKGLGIDAACDKQMPPESYRLEVRTNGIVIHATSEAGKFYGQVSARWLIETATQASIPCMSIYDAPRYAWRGFMLDESRHFFGKDEVKKILDAMARLKMNVFHWHLTDEPAWRIEIKKWPKLTTVGATGSWSDRNKPAAFYTQEDIREIVRYAAERHITIVPEIDMPGHANAATRAYPEFGAPGPGRWNGFTFHPAREETYRFLEDVLTEVAGLFPGPWIHIGGDEVHYGNMGWTTDVQIVEFTRRQGLTNAVGLEHYFVRRIADVTQNKLGKKLVGWDEIAGAGIEPGKSAAMWWHHEKPKVLDRVIADHFPIVLAPRHPCYFDFVQHDTHKIGRRWDGFNPLERVYGFPKNIEVPLAKAAPDQILGINACLWTERIADTNRLGYMTFPRLAALAESAWTPESRKNLDDFRARLPAFIRWVEQRGLSYFDVFNPAVTPEPDGPSKPDIIADG